MNVSNRIVAALALAGAVLGATGCYENRNKSIQLMNEGVELGKQKLYGTGVPKLKQATEVDPTNHLAWFNLGILYKDQRKWDDAASAFSQACKLQDANATYHYELGASYQEAALEVKHMDPNKMAKMDPAEFDRLAKTVPTKLDQAKSELELAVKLQRSYKTHFRLGTVLEAQEKYRDADQEYRKAIELNPRFPEPFIRLGNLYLDHDYDQEAVKVFQEAAKVNDSNGEVHRGLSEALQKTKQYSEAIKECEKALKHNGELFICVYNIGMSYKMLDDKKNAREWLQRFITNAGTKGSPELMKAASDAMYGLDAP